LPELKLAFPYTEGEGLHFLEIGAGTGRLSKFIKLTFPKAKITLLDLSHPYLKKAQSELQDFRKIDFVQGDAAELPFVDQKFDAVVSCFLFHELPLEVRKKTLQEAMRVLKPGGFMGHVDSLQEQDNKQFQWALKQFPQDFHEPFYKNYLQNPMEGLVLFAGIERMTARTGFLSKVVCGFKRQDSRQN